MKAAFALHVCFYNWARPHAGLDGRTPAMALGLANRARTVADLVGLRGAEEKAIVGSDKKRRGTDRKNGR